MTGKAVISFSRTVFHGVCDLLNKIQTSSILFIYPKPSNKLKLELVKKMYVLMTKPERRMFKSCELRNVTNLKHL